MSSSYLSAKIILDLSPKGKQYQVLLGIVIISVTIKGLAIKLDPEFCRA